MLKHTALILALGLSLSLTACAQSGSSTSDPAQGSQSKTDKSKSGNRQGRDGKRQGRGGEGRTPPEAAFAACASLSVQSSCSMDTPRGTLAGTCRSRGESSRLFCAVERPEGGRRPRR